MRVLDYDVLLLDLIVSEAEGVLDCIPLKHSQQQSPPSRSFLDLLEGYLRFQPPSSLHVLPNDFVCVDHV